MKRLLALSMFLIGVDPGGATNTVPPLIIKGAVNTDASAAQWTPWLCWWLRPATNSTSADGALIQDNTNRISEAVNVREAETNVVPDSTQRISDGGTNVGSIDFGASIISGRPIGRPNVEMGQQTLQLGKPAMQLGPNNMQMAPGNIQSGGPSVGAQISGNANGAIGRPNGGIGQTKP